MEKIEKRTTQLRTWQNLVCLTDFPPSVFGLQETYQWKNDQTRTFYMLLFAVSASTPNNSNNQSKGTELPGITSLQLYPIKKGLKRDDSSELTTLTKSIQDEPLQFYLTWDTKAIETVLFIRNNFFSKP